MRLIYTLILVTIAFGPIGLLGGLIGLAAAYALIAWLIWQALPFTAFGLVIGVFVEVNKRIVAKRIAAEKAAKAANVANYIGAEG